ncbi:Hydroxypyruvate isomerase, partial [Dysosmobacter welbionis]
QLDDLVQAGLTLEDAHGAGPVLQELRSQVLVKPRLQGVQIQGVGVQPVDGREMALVGQGRIQGPEDLDNPHGGLRHGLGQVAARRRHGAHGGEAAPAVIGADAGHAAGPLVELGQAGGKVRGVPLLAGHLLQPAGHLAQGLRPAGGGVSDDRHVVAHVPEVLRDGDARVDRRLTGGHGHVGGVGDQHRPLHQGLPGAGVLQLRELPEHVGHLVAPLAAADVDHDVHIRPLGQLVLHHSLAGAEGPGHGGGAALGNGEQGV